MKNSNSIFGFGISQKGIQVSGVGDFLGKKRNGFQTPAAAEPMGNHYKRWFAGSAGVSSLLGDPQDAIGLHLPPPSHRRLLQHFRWG
ncbi:unnamed protein product [Microthlaspi erraticum]|uniref:Uncharacterized protein n=1 Tax=Microthlaspi erraticum TaxID=1685480 RepID=A0A6D2JB32_9BRAS|nr:unnamed protein product [Microthlaspi erraticum]